MYFYFLMIYYFILPLFYMECFISYKYELQHDNWKSIKWPVRPAKTQVSLDIGPVWSESHVRL